MKKYHIAVFDIGKTNKKLVIFNADLKIVDIEKISIPEFESDHILYEDIESIEQWFLKTLRRKSSRFNIGVISISGHGATFTCINNKGNLAIPVISYTTDPGEDFHREFYNTFGSKIHLQKVTATPDFNLLINVAKGIWFVKRKFPDKFSHVKYILNFPQYFSYRLSGKISADPTYTGCHTYLWDFNKNAWSEVADKMGIRQLLPEKILKPWDVLGEITPEAANKTGLDPHTIITTGIHDSNASLLPHLITSKGEFVLNSTGTWCVIMHEQDKVLFNEEELGKVVFFNLSAFSKPVKTAIFMGGLEFEAYDNVLKEIHGNIENNFFDAELYEKIIDEKQLFILPGITKGTGQFPESEPRIIEGCKIYHFDQVKKYKHFPEFFNDKITAYAVLNLSLAIQTWVSLERADMRNGLPLYIEGGFSRNEAYNILMTTFYPKSNVYLTNLDEATAFGAALIGKAASEKSDPTHYKQLLNIEKKPVIKAKFRNLEGYVEKFLNLIQPG